MALITISITDIIFNDKPYSYIRGAKFGIIINNGF